MEKRKIQHLYWRAGFGIGHYRLNSLRAKIIEDLFSGSEDYSPLELDLSDLSALKKDNPKKLKSKIGELAFQELRQKSQKRVKDLNYGWIDRLKSSRAELKEKMTLFWANVFVCKDNDIFHIQRYNNTLRKYSLGNFRDFVKAIAREASMSKYLNNKQNVKENPNENFARELMELFTLGIGNYSEKDIKESARAFTGWSFKANGDFLLRKKRHDYGPKTFFGKTGNFDGDDIIDIILEKRQCAKFICSKVYKYFVNPVIDKERLEEITEIFYKDYDIKNLMYYIFNSDWFYDDKNIGVKIKSPIELLVGIHKIVPISFNKKQQLSYLQKMMGQILLYPNNVSGWKGDKNWINYNTLMFRMKLSSLLLNNAVINLKEKGNYKDSFKEYYKKESNRNKFLKVTQDWEQFEKEYSHLNPNVLKEILIVSKMDKGTENLISNLKFKSHKNYCIQLMSLPRIPVMLKKSL